MIELMNHLGFVEWDIAVDVVPPSTDTERRIAAATTNTVRCDPVGVIENEMGLQLCSGAKPSGVFCHMPNASVKVGVPSVP